MPAIRKSEAVEKLAQAVESGSCDKLAEVYTELFPERSAPDVSGASRASVAQQLAQHIRDGLEPEEIVDLWNVVFPADRHVNYDDEGDVIRYNEVEPWYAQS